MATKQLRLDVAQLTDVGRRREHNEDNMAYVIPKDLQVMAKKGALFIVADGMGGHAAGEVASEIAVDTVSTVYYQDENDDVAASLLYAIKRANALIHQRAAENMLRSGMGTTCVAAVLRGSMAYIANIGDSRAYFIRNGEVKQISQDHSWVAEQVRAGLLTEEQARTHAQRNVITRCLGTQPDVEIDVFPEPLEENDAFVLCTDGLSGLVSDDEIRRIVAQYAPQESVYHLVERANENGGPDNITAIVVSVQEVGWEPPGVRYPVYAGTSGRETGEDTAVLGINSGVLAQNPAAFENSYALNGSSAYVGGMLLSPDSITTAPQPTIPTMKQRRGRLFYLTLALVVVVILGLLGGGTYFYQHLGSGANADRSVRDAQHLIAKANNESSPAAALQELAVAQATLRALAQNSSLSATQHSQVMTVLQNDLTSGVQSAIASYNKQSAITVLCSSNSSRNTLTGAAPPPTTIALVQGKSRPLLYALGMDGLVYLVNSTSLLSVHLPIPSTIKVLGMTGNGSSLVLLVAQHSKLSDPTSPLTYTLNLLPTDQVQPGSGPNQLPMGSSVPIAANLLQNGQTPELIATSGSDVYVVFGSEATLTSVTIVDYLAKSGKSLVQTTKNTFSFSHTIMSMAAFPNHQLFFLLADGTLSSVPLTTGNQAATSVLVQNAIPQPLTISAQAFTWQTPVPAVPTGGTTSLLIPGVTSTSALAVGLVNKVPHLFILDTGLLDTRLHRVLELAPVGDLVATPTAGVTPASTSVGGGPVTTGVPVTLKLVGQFASSTLLAQGKGIAVDAQGAMVDVLTQNASPQLSLVTFGTTPQNGCA